MDHFLKKFTVIDFLGMFVPGAAVMLLWNYYSGGITEPFHAFFGEQPAILVFYFVFCSYFMGMLLQEASKPMDSLLIQLKKVKQAHQNGQQELKVKQLYRACFGKKVTDVTPQEVWRNIYLHVQSQISQSKVPLFRAFSAMGRTCSAASIVIALLYLYAVYTGAAVWSPFSLAACAVTLLAMLRRYVRFYAISVEYTYAIFIKSGCGQTSAPPAPQSAAESGAST